MEQPIDQDIRPILEEAETRQCPERKDVTDRSLTHKIYGTQWKSLSMRNGILKRCWESTDRRSKIAQIVLPWRRVNNVLTDTTGFRQETILRNVAGSATPVQPVAAPEPRIGAKCISTLWGPCSKG
jgi:hypothetical protein